MAALPTKVQVKNQALSRNERADDIARLKVGVWGAMEPKTNISLTTSAQSPLPRHPPR